MATRHSPEIQVFMEEPWPVDKNEYELEEIIGSGSTAIVCKSFCKKRKEICAIKRVDLEKSDLVQIAKELTKLKLCRHRNIVSYYTSFYVRSELWIVMRLSDRGSLRQILDRQILSMGGRCSIKKGVLNQKVIATILKEVLIGLEYIHDKEVLHGDVKTANILISSEGAVQLADFGPSVWVQGEERTKNKMAGTACYLAPELAGLELGEPEMLPTFLGDIWSVGIVALEMVTGYPPYHNKIVSMILKWVRENEPPNLETFKFGDYHEYGKKYRHFVSSCLKRCAKQRWSAKKLISHPFIISNAQNGEYLMTALMRALPYVVLPGDEKSSRKHRPPISSDNDDENLEHATDNVTWDYNIPVDEEQSSSVNRISKTSSSSYTPMRNLPSAEITMCVTVIQTEGNAVGSEKTTLSEEICYNCKCSIEQQVFKLVKQQKLEPKYIVIVAAKLWQIIAAAQCQDIEGKYFAFVIDKSKEFITILDIYITLWCYITDHRIAH